MRTVTRIGFCTAVGTVLLLTGCTTNYYGRPNPKPLPPGQAKKYETYGHNKPKHVPPGQAKKQPVAVRQDQQNLHQQQQVTNVHVTMHESPGVRQRAATSATPAPANAAEAAPVVLVTEEQTYASKTKHVPPGQLRKQETYGHQKQSNVPPGQARKVESEQRRDVVQKQDKQEYKQEPKQVLKQEPRQEVKRSHKQEQPQQPSRGNGRQDESDQKQEQEDSSRGSGKKNGKK